MWWGQAFGCCEERCRATQDTERPEPYTQWWLRWSVFCYMILVQSTKGIWRCLLEVAGNSKEAAGYTRGESGGRSGWRYRF